MKNTEIIIKEDCIDDAINVSQKIPEFDNTYAKSEYVSRLKNVKYLVLTAYIDNKPVGFKIGYETTSKQNFYSWMGGGQQSKSDYEVHLIDTSTGIQPLP